MRNGSRFEIPLRTLPISKDWRDDTRLTEEEVAAIPQRPKPFSYHVGSGPDKGTLFGVAKLLYGDGKKWPMLLDANRDELVKPELLKNGMRLLIPNLGETKPTPINENGEASDKSTSPTADMAGKVVGAWKCKASDGTKVEYNILKDGRAFVSYKDFNKGTMRSYSAPWKLKPDGAIEITVRQEGRIITGIWSEKTDTIEFSDGKMRLVTAKDGEAFKKLREEIVKKSGTDPDYASGTDLEEVSLASLKKKMPRSSIPKLFQKGDVIYYFDTGGMSFYKMAGRKGHALVRGDKVIVVEVGIMN